jgi:DNA-binding transcriptional regulator GbsR (MarR family)
MLNLTPAAERFILHWGEMGSRWGVNRTVAQIHALLYIAPQPLDAEQIASTLSVARSNVSTSLRELQAWGLVKVVHTLGGRRDYFEGIRDVWQIFRAIVAERFQREIEPTLGVLAECVTDAERRKEDDPDTWTRLGQLHDFFKTLDSWRRQLLELSPREIKRASTIGSKVKNLLRTGS